MAGRAFLTPAAAAAAEAFALAMAEAVSQAEAAAGDRDFFHRPVDAEYAVTLVFKVVVKNGFRVDLKTIFETAENAVVQLSLGAAPPGPLPKGSGASPQWLGQ